MTCSELMEILQREDIPQDIYSLTNDPPEGDGSFICFFSKKKGKWIVGILERYKFMMPFKYTYDNEEEAAYKMLELMAEIFPQLRKYL